MTSSFMRFRHVLFVPLALAVLIFFPAPLFADETSPESPEPGTQTVTESADQTADSNPSGVEYKNSTEVSESNSSFKKSSRYLFTSLIVIVTFEPLDIASVIYE